MSDPIFFAPLRVPIVDARTGLMSREWYLFFQAMYLRVGGVSAPNNEDLQLIADVYEAVDDGNPIQSNVANVEQALAFSDEPQLTSAADVAELQSLMAGFGEDPTLGRFNAVADGLVPASGGGTAKFLRADGTFTVPFAPSPAAPSALVGLAAIPGAAATFMRSDAAPALDQAIAPTWTKPHLFTASGAAAATAAINITATSLPTIYMDETSSGADAGRWRLFASAGRWLIGTINDLESASRNAVEIDRTGVAVTAVNLGNTTDNSALNALGTGPATFGGSVKVVGNSGFNNTAPITKPTVTGSRAANAALASLLTALASYGLLTDSSSP